MRSKKLLAVSGGIVVGVMLFSACASSPTTEGTAVVSTADESDGGGGAGEIVSVTQFASAMAPTINHASESLEKWDEMQLDAAVQGEDSIEAALCPRYLSLAGVAAHLLSVGIENAQTPGAPNFVGAVPDELVGLVSETDETAKKFEAATEESEGECTFLTVSFEEAALNDVLQKWQPYL